MQGRIEVEQLKGELNKADVKNRGREDLQMEDQAVDSTLKLRMRGLPRARTMLGARGAADLQKTEGLSMVVWCVECMLT